MHPCTGLVPPLPRVPPGLLSQPVHLLAGLMSLPSLVPIVGPGLGLIVSQGGVDGVVIVILLGAVLRVPAGVGPLLGREPLLEGDGLAGEGTEASVRISIPIFLRLVGESTGRNGFSPANAFMNPNSNEPSLTPSLCRSSIFAILDLTLCTLVLFSVNVPELFCFILVFRCP